MPEGSTSPTSGPETRRQPTPSPALTDLGGGAVDLGGKDVDDASAEARDFAAQVKKDLEELKNIREGKAEGLEGKTGVHGQLLSQGEYDEYCERARRVLEAHAESLDDLKRKYEARRAQILRDARDLATQAAAEGEAKKNYDDIKSNLYLFKDSGANEATERAVRSRIAEANKSEDRSKHLILGFKGQEGVGNYAIPVETFERTLMVHDIQHVNSIALAEYLTYLFQRGQMGRIRAVLSPKNAQFLARAWLEGKAPGDARENKNAPKALEEGEEIRASTAKRHILKNTDALLGAAVIASVDKALGGIMAENAAFGDARGAMVRALGDIGKSPEEISKAFGASLKEAQQKNQADPLHIARAMCEKLNMDPRQNASKFAEAIKAMGDQIDAAQDALAQGLKGEALKELGEKSLMSLVDNPKMRREISYRTGIDERTKLSDISSKDLGELDAALRAAGLPGIGGFDAAALARAQEAEGKSNTARACVKRADGLWYCATHQIDPSDVLQKGEREEEALRTVQSNLETARREAIERGVLPKNTPSAKELAQNTEARKAFLENLKVSDPSNDWETALQVSTARLAQAQAATESARVMTGMPTESQARAQIRVMENRTAEARPDAAERSRQDPAAAAQRFGLET